MGISHRIHLQKLTSGDVIPRAPHVAPGKELPLRLREQVRALGPMPKTCLEVFVDLGLSDGEIARYFDVPQACITKLCDIWCMRR